MAAQGFGEDLKYIFNAVVGASDAAKETYERVCALSACGRASVW